MRHLRLLAGHPVAGPGLRYVITGAIVATIYLGLPVLLNAGAGIPLQVAIPLAYAIALSVHFTLQRHFVFRHVERFALSARQQAGRYAAIAAIQYPTTAILTAVLPGIIGVSPRIAYVCVALVVSVSAFLTLRSHIFHSDGGDGLGDGGGGVSGPAPRRAR